MKEISQLPANVRLGNDRSIEIGENNGESKFEFIESNFNNGVMRGGPSVYLQK
jgi:hypothetical protein